MSYDLPALCRQVRRDILTMTHAAGSGHPGGSLSAVEILVTLYFDQMHLDPAQPEDPNRDRFLLSKGHAAPVLYSAWPGGASLIPPFCPLCGSWTPPSRATPPGKAAGAGLLLRLPGPGVVRRQWPGSGRPADRAVLPHLLPLRGWGGAGGPNLGGRHDRRPVLPGQRLRRGG